MRRLLTHIKALPPDSATSRKHQGAPMGWDNTTEMVAAVVDAVNVQTRVLLNVNSTSPDRSEVERVPRPYEAKPVAETVNLAEFGDWLKED